ncbi:hypothetical protein [Salipiger bermudensis]|uniref:hypothetical protein n=1 Tax=Salipiger bermudensis TaxID=344736 RepID=UPI001A8DAD71|nr:hypothetical protein [Salipiger bermudensis]MBN9674747.1 hypothetical protein [Salipiger bermudensis]
MLDFFFRPKRPIAPGTPSRPLTEPAREVPKDAAPQINTAQPEDLAFWRAEDELAKLAALARGS